AMRAGTLLASCTLLACWCLLTADRLGTFEMASNERRYVAVGQYLRVALPSNALLLTVIESGSVRLYGGRLTLRWDMVPSDKLDQTVQTLRAGGYVPYILLEDWEENSFRQRFGRAN